MSPLGTVAMSPPQEQVSSGNSTSSPAAGGSNRQIKKRNRISFVCQECRKAKTKCDKEKPACTRCVKQNLACVYDVAKQPPPRIPSKDAKITRLENDVEYWKNKAMKLLEEKEQTNGKSNGFKRSSSYVKEEELDRVDNQTIDKRLKTQSTVPLQKATHATKDDIMVNLYKNNPTMIMSKVMKREVKPLSENYILIQDKFISTLISSVFLDPSKNTMIPALTANANISRTQPSVTTNALKLKEILVKQCQNPSQEAKVNEFTDRILQNTNSTRNLKVGMILSMLYNTVGHQHLEDHCPADGEYSELLKTFINEFEQILPPYEIIMKYKAFFAEYVYPNLPFMEQEMFEESIATTIFPNEEDPTKIKIKLGNTRLRSKVENMCMLLVILKLAYISISLVEEIPQDDNLQFTKDIIVKYPIPNDAILLAQRCLASEDWCACANENIITCLLYIWSFFVFSPEEGDFFLEHPTDVIGSLIMMLATSIGLHRDPSDFPQLQDPNLSDRRILNHRRLLWIGIVTVCSFESSLKGRHSVSSMALMDLFIDVKDPAAAEKYIARVKADAKPTMDERLISIHEYSFKRVRLALLLSDLDNLTMSYNNDFPLSAIDNLAETTRTFIETNFPIINLKEINISKEQTPESLKSHLLFLATINSTSIHSRIMFRLMMLRTAAALFLYFESEMAKNKSSSLLPYYYKYFTKTCTYALALITDFNKFFKGEYDDCLSPLTTYNITKFIQLALPSTIFSLLGIILRISLGGNMLFSEYQEYPNKEDYAALDEINKRIESLNALHKDLESALENIHILASQHLRFTFFSVFKMLALCDVIIQRMRKGELWLGIFEMVHMRHIHQRIVKTLTMTIGFEADKKESLIDDLKLKNHIVQFSMNDITNLRQNVIDASLGVQGYGNKPPSQPSSSETSVPLAQPVATKYSNPVYDWNSSLGNLGKLSTAALISQNSTQVNNTPINGGPNMTPTPPLNGESIPPQFGRGGVGAGTNGLQTDFTGFFGGLDLFDYDFLFGNDFT